MIERKNIIRLIGDRTNVYHSALLTTYSFDPIFFESVYLSTLRKLGITNVVVLMDASMYDQLLADSEYHCHRVSLQNYTLVRQVNVHSGVFHPKMVLLFGEEEGTLIVGSGNLTYSGITNNDEVWNVFHVQGSNSTHYSLFYQAWKYLLSSISRNNSLVRKQINWMLEQSPWLNKESADESVQLSSGEDCFFFYNSTEQTIINRLIFLVGNKNIVQIKVVSPFYDIRGNALIQLYAHFNPQQFICILDLKRKSAPKNLLNNSNIVFWKADSSNPLHAKIYELQAENETWLLCGSANAGNMALGTNQNEYNDEACILLHCNTKKNYIENLGIHCSILSEYDKTILLDYIPEESRMRTDTKVKIVSCEEQNDELHLYFDKSDIDGNLVLLDNLQKTIHSKKIRTSPNISISLKDMDISKLHMAVLMDNNNDISNRILVVREVCVERGNPDPKRRNLTRLLEASDLLNNLRHILGFIEFDDSEKKSNSSKSDVNPKSKDCDDNVVSQERFCYLRDTTVSISMHSGVRILSYLQQILFRNDDIEQTDDELLQIENKDSEGENEKESELSHKTISQNEVNKARTEVANYLKKMLAFLQEKTKDKSIYGGVTPKVKSPYLIAEPGLNAASSLVVASRSIIFLMNKYSSSVTKRSEVKNFFINCCGIFLSLYSNRVPDTDTLRNRKIRELLCDATIDMLSALCFFEYEEKDHLMTQLILNALELWRGEKEIDDIIPQFHELLSKLNNDALNKKTIERINAIADRYLAHAPTIMAFSLDYDSIYQFCKGYGFLIVDNLKRTSKGWSFVYRSPWFEDKIDNSTATKFMGYYNL